jgi:hypothetical protein
MRPIESDAVCRELVDLQILCRELRYEEGPYSITTNQGGRTRLACVVISIRSW